MHFVSAHLYTYLCVPMTLTGFLLSPFMTMSPHCQALRWSIYNGASTINLLWFVVANWVISKFSTIPQLLEKVNF